MKLSELLKDAKFPVKVRHKDWVPGEWFEVLAPRRSKGYPGFDQEGIANDWNGDGKGWELYVEEPKPKKKLYGWLTRFKDVNNYAINYNVILIEQEQMVPMKDIEAIRAPMFDCEVEI